ncbi:MULTISPECIES: ABC transporter ATP-binding protein [Aerococcus]|uniref:ATP-binding cassette domain-containing protein n=1 Tax=Aerococcus mictus TaxID=2976810 RepID=A0A1E9PLY0_9LACT|nr:MULTISPECIES: ATP-binding cassette domain-containing protein [Aerococcus]KAA9290581.1 ATP-binding cassette domain-containing protein [Aerococcus mictus]MBU5611007.1 ATP-binding cassette domain-containing protein [Aerococcus urinae]MCY3034891.1 ATP-binding cassette domain-containing protein [Aerococcus mictus]MCY3063345.1 ATP-binding cassette domain-containing protein [Aerococcus mictus]MCY3066019.1 ATP-binding cassette domain-containing protein [Aerococcus mictus]
MKENIIQVDHLTIASDQGDIIKDLSFTIEAGEFVGVKGPSGSGKSTLLKYLAQLYDPALQVSGSYQLNGQAIEDYPPTTIRKQVSYCFQSPQLFGHTVRENLAFPFEIRGEDFDEDLAKRGLEAMALDRHFIDKEIDTLSGGEKQRVALIRNLFFEPRVLLLDEITSALDAKSRDLVWSWLKDYRAKHQVTYLMVSHIDSEHEMTDRTLTLSATEKAPADEEESASQEKAGGEVGE